MLWDVRTLCAAEPPPGLYGVVGTGLLWDVSTLCAAEPPPGLYGVVGTGVLWDVSTLVSSSWTIWGGGHRFVVGCQYTQVANRTGLARREREWPLNDGQIPNFRGARVHVSTGYVSREIDRRRETAP